MPHSVFVSSTADLSDYRARALNAILKAGLRPVMMEYFAASGAAPPLDLCLQKVTDSSVVVVLVAHRYGWVPPSQLQAEYKSITWLECEQAARDGKEVLAFLLNNDYPWPENLKEEYNLVAALRDNTLDLEAVEKVRKNYAGLNQFKDWLNSRGIRATFSSPDDLETKVLHSLIEWKRSRSRTSKRIEPQADVLEFRNRHRRRLTDLMCIYYTRIKPDNRAITAPNDMPVLAQAELIPADPFPLVEFDKNLTLDRTPDVAPSTSDSSGFLKVLLQNRAESTLFNGLLFRYMGLHSGSKLSFRLGYYFDFLNTSEILGYELANAVMRTPRLRRMVENEALPLDAEAEHLLAKPGLFPLREKTTPTAFESRCTAFGSCALVIVKRTNQAPEMILNVRSSTLAETAGLIHVIPAGTFQPTMQDERFLNTEFSITENLVREFAEELFDDAGISGREARRVVFGTLDDLYGPKGKEFRTRIIRANRYKCLYLGTVIDPVNLKPEALTIFLVHEGYMYSVAGRELQPCWETEAGAIEVHEFSLQRLDELISTANLVPTGKAHLMLVRKHFARLITELNDV